MKLGVCFSGGGTKAFAHIGALKAIEEAGIKFNYFAGTSSGSIIATLYAIGYTPDEIYNIFNKYYKKIKYIDLKNIIRILKNLFMTGKLKIDGLNSGEKIYKLVKKYCNQKGVENIKDIKNPLLIPAVNIRDETLYIFYSKEFQSRQLPENIKYKFDADIGAVVQASCSYPGIFSPCTRIEDFLLVDGGIEENVPWREEKRVGADKVLSIVFTNTQSKKCCNNIFEILIKSFGILCHELSRHEWKGTDYLLEIKYDSSGGLLNSKNAKKLYDEGYLQAKEFLKNNIIKDAYGL